MDYSGAAKSRVSLRNVELMMRDNEKDSYALKSLFKAKSDQQHRSKWSVILKKAKSFSFDQKYACEEIQLLSIAIFFVDTLISNQRSQTRVHT